MLTPKGYQEPTSYGISINWRPGQVEHYEKHEGVRMLNYVPKGGGPGFEGLDKWLAALVKETNPLYRWCRIFAEKKILILAKGKRQALLRILHSYCKSHFGGEIGTPVFVQPPSGDTECTSKVMMEMLTNNFETHNGFNLIVVSYKANGHLLAKHTLEAMGVLRFDSNMTTPVVVMETSKKEFHKKHKAQCLGWGASGYINSMLSLFDEIARVLEIPPVPNEMEEALTDADRCSVM